MLGQRGSIVGKAFALLVVNQAGFNPWHLKEHHEHFQE